ncbi:DUF3298 and DUF4163 domain-containing protein [Brachyspira hampsonii]|uniref:Dynein heavy chain n=1 Tax=Brachyspira hampsonii 30446 TaxID=1289135 RepID=A0A2U4FGU4_9SPIR|nr:DUF3298 and DUF4163 domain-containing protein [Brachyspira hampsonii]EKV56381.1 dynein heavy chain [Brachyspira hampsonii 30446]MBW5389460.1 DUF3298 domain-containing protein [Brachyspira hampsonii]MBW5394653.1 DUF3298 domain-containing protein [Brachyspira hampsonii]OEJ20137.1 sulfurtransferase [Brachyspira hampsonii]
MKTNFKVMILSLLLAVACSNSNKVSNNTKTDINIPLSENEKLYDYEAVYLMSDNGEYISSALTYNTNNLGTIVYTDSNQNSVTFNVERIGELDEGSISAFSYDNNTLEGNIPSVLYPFNAKIDNKEITFKSVKSSITGARIIEYSYTNVSPNSDNIFEYKNAIFVLNNENNSEIINKINIDINKDLGITDADSFNDLGALLEKENIISNKMNAFYDEWVNSGYIANTSEDLSQYGINYLSEKFISINKFIYSYTGGAHGNYATIYSVYSLENGNKLKIEDLISDLKNENLLNLIKYKLLKIEGRDENSYFDLNELSLENNNFYIAQNGLVFTWGIYEIGPYAMGDTKVLIPSEEIKPYLKDEYKTIF